MPLDGRVTANEQDVPEQAVAGPKTLLITPILGGDPIFVSGDPQPRWVASVERHSSQSAFPAARATDEKHPLVIDEVHCGGIVVPGHLIVADDCDTGTQGLELVQAGSYVNSKLIKVLAVLGGKKLGTAIVLAVGVIVMRLIGHDGVKTPLMAVIVHAVLYCGPHV